MRIHDSVSVYLKSFASMRLALSASTSSSSTLGCASLCRGTAWILALALGNSPCRVSLRFFNSSSPAFVFSKSSWKFLKLFEDFEVKFMKIETRFFGNTVKHSSSSSRFPAKAEKHSTCSSLPSAPSSLPLALPLALPLLVQLATSSPFRQLQSPFSHMFNHFPTFSNIFKTCSKHIQFVFTCLGDGTADGQLGAQLWPRSWLRRLPPQVPPLLAELQEL